MKLNGWVSSLRDMGGLKFFLLRSEQGLVQVTAKKGNVPDEVFEMFSKLNREDCVSVEGDWKDAKQAPGGKEFVPKKIELISESVTPLPIDIEGDSGKDKRLDFRFMDLRNPKIAAIFKIRAEIFRAMREFYSRSGFTEVQTPIIQAAGAEGGAELFPIIYYGKEAFLRQSPQLYKQMLMASGLDKIFEVGTVFRSEKSHTRKH